MIFGIALLHKKCYNVDEIKKPEGMTMSVCGERLRELRVLNNLTQQRPSDCVAIKFIPILEETEVIDIEWFKDSGKG